MKGVRKNKMNGPEMERRITVISEAVVGLKYYEWSRIKMAIDKRFSSASAKVVLEDAEGLKASIRIEL